MNKELLSRLKDIFPQDRIITEKRELVAYSSDASIFTCLPELIVRPIDEVEVERLIKLTAESKIPIVARGSGTSLCGQSTPVEGSIVVDFTLMNRIICVSPENRYVTLEPGVIYNDLAGELAKIGFSFPPEPGSATVATIGGMVAVNASGVNSFKYGATRDYVLGLTFFTGTGEKIITGGSTLKDASSYQLSRLLVGSEGTLGLITSITLKIIPLPPSRGLVTGLFKSLRGAGDSVARIIASGITPVGIEFLDSICLNAIRNAGRFDLPLGEAMLFVLLDGNLSGIKQDAEQVTQILKSLDAIRIDMSLDDDEIDLLYSIRRSLVPSLSRFTDNLAAVELADDMSIKPSSIPDVVEMIHSLAEEESGVLIPIYGHAADGNLHTRFLIDPRDGHSMKVCQDIADKIYIWVKEHDGLISGEHGIGYAKQKYLDMSSSEIMLMQNIKQVFDPHNILNPGKYISKQEGELKIRFHPCIRLEDMGEEGDTQREIDACIYCGFCKDACPVFKITREESISPRGQVMSMNALYSNELSRDDPIIAQGFLRCLQCLACKNICPSGIRVPDIIINGRESGRFVSLSKEAITGLTKTIEETGNIYGERPVLKHDTEGDVALFLGCRYVLRNKELNAAGKILLHIGIKPQTIDEICCGYPLKILGDKDAFRMNKEKLEEKLLPKQVLSLCPTCAIVLKEDYGRDAVHLISFLHKHLNKLRLRKSGATVTWHDPCHLSRGLGIVSEPREMLRALGFSLVEMKHHGLDTLCCGGGGGLLVTDEGLARRQAEIRINEAVDTGAEYLITFCSTCEHVLRQASLIDDEPAIKVRNILDMIAIALELKSP